MRRAATLFVAVGLTVTGLGAWSAAPSWAHDRLLARSRASGPGGPPRAAGATKVVRYDGYALTVPASWPVYRLDQDPSRCVRYDQHAVYLGTPGTAQDCPAHMVGHVATISVQPSTPAQMPAAGPMWHVSGFRMGPQQGAGGTGSAGGVLLQDSQDQEFRTSTRRPGLTVEGTYGGDAPMVARVMGSLHRVGAAGGAASARAASQSGSTPATGAPAVMTAIRTWVAHRARPVLAGLLRRRHHHHHRRHRHRRAAAARHTAASGSGVRGFDACTAPSLQVMRGWRPYFGAVNIYLGGPEVACGYGNLSPAWVRSVIAMRWALIPTYVGPQAPCTTFQERIVVGHAFDEGRRSARDAIRLARALGIGRGAPIYDDMEYYKARRGTCRRQVVSFLNGWTRQLHADGYLSGVYGSADAAAHDLGAASMIYGKRLVKPDTMWFALWDGVPNLAGGPYLTAGWWPGNRRIKQYRGAHDVRLAGHTLNVDSDLVDGAVYR